MRNNIKERGIAVPIRDLNLPPVLYKFRELSKSQHVESLFKSEIYIPSANSFNDPYDSMLPFRYHSKDLTPENLYLKGLELVKNNKQFKNEEERQAFVYDMQRADLMNNPDHLEWMDKVERERMNKEFGLFCLTPKIENLLMWSYYSDSHTGFAIGFDTIQLVESGLFNMGGLVEYIEEFPKFPLFPPKENVGSMFSNIFFKKSKEWAHEDEYRLLHSYKKGKVHKIDPLIVKEIVFGCKTDEKKELETTNRILKVYPHIKISKMELKKEAFGMKKTLRF